MSGAGVPVTVYVNGVPRSLRVGAGETLLHTLRERLGLTGTKEGCSEGECGACTVLIDGVPVDSCLFPAATLDGRAVTTIEGVGSPEQMSPLQVAMADRLAVQCGFCTPGFVMTLTALLDGSPSPSRDEVKEAVAGNICRCTGYSQILAAVSDVAFEGGGE